MKSAKNFYSQSISKQKKNLSRRARTPPKKSGWGVRRGSSRPPGADFLNSGTPKTQESALPET